MAEELSDNWMQLLIVTSQTSRNGVALFDSLTYRTGQQIEYQSSTAAVPQQYLCHVQREVQMLCAPAQIPVRVSGMGRQHSMRARWRPLIIAVPNLRRRMPQRRHGGRRLRRQRRAQCRGQRDQRQRRPSEQRARRTCGRWPPAVRGGGGGMRSDRGGGVPVAAKRRRLRTSEQSDEEARRRNVWREVEEKAEGGG